MTLIYLGPTVGAGELVVPAAAGDMSGLLTEGGDELLTEAGDELTEES